jgi:capsular polysaccharide biosynthesis protein
MGSRIAGNWISLGLFRRIIMEIKVYLRLLQKRWWIVLSLLIVALAATAYFTLKMRPVYQAEATYIVRISAFAEERNIISALNTLTSRTEIAATYAGVANSSLIKNKAADALGISHPENLSVKSQMKSGTNIVEITVEGDDPALVRDYTNAIGTQTVNYVESLYETYRLELLDEAAYRNHLSSQIWFRTLPWAAY